MISSGSKRDKRISGTKESFFSFVADMEGKE
jgi:hypothetical protein